MTWKLQYFLCFVNCSDSMIHTIIVIWWLDKFSKVVSYLRRRKSRSRSRPGGRWPRCPRTWRWKRWPASRHSDPWTPASTPPGTSTSLGTQPQAHAVSHSAIDPQTCSHWKNTTNSQSASIINFRPPREKAVRRKFCPPSSTLHSIEIERRWISKSSHATTSSTAGIKLELDGPFLFWELRISLQRNNRIA